jgi:flagellar FliL protein
MMGASADKPKAVKKDEAPVYVKLEPFVVNVQANDGDGRFLQVELNLKVDGQDIGNQLKTLMPEVRHHIILLLSSKKTADLDTLEKKQDLAKEISSMANRVAGKVAGGQKVRETMFLSLAMQ